MSTGCSHGKPTSCVCNPRLRVCYSCFVFYSPEAAPTPRSHRQARAASHRSAQSSLKDESRPKIQNFGSGRSAPRPAMAAAGRHRPDGKGRDGIRPRGTCAPRSAARRERERKGRVGRREGRPGCRTRERHAGAGAELSRARFRTALRAAGAAAGRGGEARRGEGRGRAAPRRGGGRRAGGVFQRRARDGHYPKGEKKKRAVIKVAAAARGPTLRTGRLLWQTGGDSRAALPRSRAATSAATSRSLPRPPWQHRRRRLPPSRVAPRIMAPAAPRLVLGLLVSEWDHWDEWDEWVGAGGSAAERAGRSRTWARLSSALLLLYRGCAAHGRDMERVISGWLLAPCRVSPRRGPCEGRRAARRLRGRGAQLGGSAPGGIQWDARLALGQLLGWLLEPAVGFATGTRSGRRCCCWLFIEKTDRSSFHLNLPLGLSPPGCPFSVGRIVPQCGPC